MSESQLNKVQSEIARLKQEHETVKEALTKTEACKEIVDYVESQTDPFEANSDPNMWASNQSSGGCCIIA